MESQSAEKVRRVQERRRSGASGKHQNRGERRARTRSASRRRAITQED